MKKQTTNSGANKDSKIKVGSDFSGVGAFNQALMRLGINYEEVFACDFDRFARETFIHNYGEPKYYPENVYDREIPGESLDIYMTSPPCQAFSLAGNRLGEDDDRGILFYNSHEFIVKNKPRFFIFENVKGLLSDDCGRTFGRWVEWLGGKSVNGNPVLFPDENSVPYHIYHKVLNSKDFNVPQNRERVFIVGIRDDMDNVFRWPLEVPIDRKLYDVLEDEDTIDERYYISERMIKGFIEGTERHKAKGNGFKFEPVEKKEAKYSNTIICGYGNKKTDTFLKVRSNTNRGYEEARLGDGINLAFPNSKTRRGRVGKGVAQTLDTSCEQGVVVYGDLFGNKWENTYDQSRRVYDPKGQSPTIHTMSGGGQGVKIHIDYSVRKLTPRECFRLMDFPDTFDFSVVSNTQAYKQAGNSIVVAVLAGIIENLKL